MPVVEFLGAAQLVVAVVGLQLQNMMTPTPSARFFKRTTDRRFELGMLKIRSRTSITRRR